MPAKLPPKTKSIVSIKEAAKFLSALFGTKILSSADVDEHLILPSELSHLHFTVRSRAEFDFHKLFGNECKELSAWISELKNDVQPNQTWMLLFKVDYLGWYIATPASDSHRLRSYARVVSTEHGNIHVASAQTFLGDNVMMIRQQTKEQQQ